MSYSTLPISKADVDRRGGEYASTEPPLKPNTGGRVQLDEAVFRGPNLFTVDLQVTN